MQSSASGLAGLDATALPTATAPDALAVVDSVAQVLADVAAAGGLAAPYRPPVPLLLTVQVSKDVLMMQQADAGIAFGIVSDARNNVVSVVGQRAPGSISGASVRAALAGPGSCAWSVLADAAYRPDALQSAFCAWSLRASPAATAGTAFVEIGSGRVVYPVDFVQRTVFVPPSGRRLHTSDGRAVTGGAGATFEGFTAVAREPVAGQDLLGAGVPCSRFARVDWARPPQAGVPSCELDVSGSAAAVASMPWFAYVVGSTDGGGGDQQVWRFEAAAISGNATVTRIRTPVLPAALYVLQVAGTFGGRPFATHFRPAPAFANQGHSLSECVAHLLARVLGSSSIGSSSSPGGGMLGVDGVADIALQVTRVLESAEAQGALAGALLDISGPWLLPGAAAGLVAVSLTGELQGLSLDTVMDLRNLSAKVSLPGQATPVELVIDRIPFALRLVDA